MSTTTGVTAATTAATMTAADAMKKSTGLNKDDFLKLFITQLKNQDPLNPQDGAEFVTQMAQLTQVEQSYNTNTNLEKLILANKNAAAFSAINLAGKGIIATGDKVGVVQPGTKQQLLFELPAAANGVMVEIRDSAGSLIRSIPAGIVGAGKNSIQWDGLSADGTPVQRGVYSVSVSGKAADGSKVTGTTFVSGIVGSVMLDSAEPTLLVNGVEVQLSQVISVGA